MDRHSSRSSQFSLHSLISDVKIAGGISWPVIDERSTGESHVHVPLDAEHMIQVIVKLKCNLTYDTSHCEVKVQRHIGYKSLLK